MLTNTFLFSEKKRFCLLLLFLFALFYIIRQSKPARNILDNFVTDSRNMTSSDISIKSVEEIRQFAGTGLSNYMKTDIKRNAENKTSWVILVIVNSGYMDFFLNWYVSFKRFNLHVPLIVTAEDDESYENLKRYQNYSMRIKRSEDFSIQKASRYNSRNYNFLVNRRPKQILTYLSLGLNVLYVDVDTVWLKNPFPSFEGDFDIGLAGTGKHHYFNSGLIAIRSNNVSKTLMYMWDIELGVKSRQPNQPALNSVLAKLKHKLKIRVLDSRKFPTGCLLFGGAIKITIPDEVVIVHLSCITGHRKKLQHFIENGLWYIQTDGKNEILDLGNIERILK